MILGYEQPIDIPMMSMYDKDMMRLYLGALQKDYEQGIEDQKEFNKTFGDFYSPSSTDMANWYNMTQKPIQDFLNENPNAARSIEGRSQLQRIRNRIASNPELQLMRYNAKNLENRIKAENAIKAQGGSVLPDGIDAYNWNTLENGMFSNVSPIAAKSLDELLKPSIDTLKDEYRLDQDKMKNNPGWKIENVAPERIREQMKTTIASLKQTPYWEYYKNKLGLNDDSLTNLATDYVENSIGEKWDKDDVYFSERDYKLKLQNAERDYKLRLQDAAETKRHNIAMENAQRDKNKKEDSMYSSRYQSFQDGLAKIGYTDTGLETYSKKYASSIVKDYKRKHPNASAETLNKIYTTNYINAKRNAQIKAQAAYAKKNNSKGTASLALAHNAAESELVNRFGIHDFDEDGNLTIDNSNKHNVYKITDVTYNSGYINVSTNKKYRDGLTSLKLVTSTGNNMITQYQPKDGTYHQYAKMTDGSNIYWYDTGSVDVKSGKAQEADVKSLHNMDQSVKAVDTPLDLAQ